MRRRQDVLDHLTKLRDQARKNARKAAREERKQLDFIESMAAVRAIARTTMQMLDWMREQGPQGVALADEYERQQDAESDEIHAEVERERATP